MGKWKKQIVWGLVLALAAGYFFFLREPNVEREALNLNVTVVDYTTPFSTYKEHLGILWLLNHLKVKAPGGYRSWRPAKDYIGYYPHNRNAPARLADINIGSADVLYLADTYGVYADDLKVEGIAHMDHSQLVFGGLSTADAAAVSRFVTRGGTLIVEFNVFCDPTEAPARQVMEDLLGLEWSGWVGRVFVNPLDPNDVPHWLPREWARQHPNEPLPASPTLLLANRDGQIKLFSARALTSIAPRIELTAAGVIDLGLMAAPPPYYAWFPLMRERPGTKVYARWSFSERPDIREFLVAQGLSEAPPVISRTTRGESHIYHFGGDFADVDFDPGPFDGRSFEALRADTPLDSNLSSAPAFWHIYAPAIARILSDEAERSKRRAQQTGD